MDVEVTTLLEAARLRSETAIGFRQAALTHDKAENYGVLLNPPKSQRVTFQPGDQVIVLGER
ncbi:hypothetical protein [Microbacterium sp.]|uniref:hypothetical protein n=1 Tax=Microbacterium sp. TaxID=51671 RepID=UPI003A932683